MNLIRSKIKSFSSWTCLPIIMIMTVMVINTKLYKDAYAEEKGAEEKREYKEPQRNVGKDGHGIYIGEKEIKEKKAKESRKAERERYEKDKKEKKEEIKKRRKEKEKERREKEKKKGER
jgi:hypothetical protein